MGDTGWIPSGELTFCHGKSQFLMGKSTISMAIFHCYVSSPEGIVLHEPEKCQLAARDVAYHGCCFVHPRKRTECTQLTSRSTVKYVPGFDFLPYAIQFSYFRYRESSMLNYCL